jgi:hypothetical protein
MHLPNEAALLLERQTEQQEFDLAGAHLPHGIAGHPMARSRTN